MKIMLNLLREDQGERGKSRFSEQTLYELGTGIEND